MPQKNQRQTAILLTHCRRELMHQVWCLMLDEEFVEAYRHGIILLCADGVLRRVYPRIFTYSADYPEKYTIPFPQYSYFDMYAFRALLAAIRERGLCPCPRCLVPKSELHQMGLVEDMKKRISRARTYLSGAIDAARKAIYTGGLYIMSAPVERLLKPFSLVPTMVCITTLLT